MKGEPCDVYQRSTAAAQSRDGLVGGNSPKVQYRFLFVRYHMRKVIKGKLLVKPRRSSAFR